MRHQTPKCRFDVPYHRKQTRSNVVDQTLFREAECRRAAIECVGAGSVVEPECDAGGADVVVPVADRNRKSVFRDRLAGTFQPVAHLWPAAAVMFAQDTRQFRPIVLLERPEIGAAYRAGCNRHAGADVKLNADRLAAAALPEIDHAVTVAAADGNGSAGRAHHFLA